MHINPLLIVNPDSGRYSACRIAHITTELTRLGLTPSIISARSPAEVKGSLRSICLCDKQQFIIVAAGDGTFNAVLNSIEPGTATLAVLPMGTSNVMAAELGIQSLNDGIQRISRHTVRHLPVGLAQLEGRQYYFSLMAGVGVDGAVVRDVRSGEKRLLKQGAFALSALRNLWSWDQDMIEVVSNGKSVFCHTAVICNASRYAGNFVLAPGGELFSNVFAVICVTTDKRGNYMQIAYDLFQGLPVRENNLIRMTSTDIEIRGTKPIQIDGDFIGYAPASISLVTGFAKIIV